MAGVKGGFDKSDIDLSEFIKMGKDLKQAGQDFIAAGSDAKKGAETITDAAKKISNVSVDTKKLDGSIKRLSESFKKISDTDFKISSGKSRRKNDIAKQFENFIPGVSDAENYLKSKQAALVTAIQDYYSSIDSIKQKYVDYDKSPNSSKLSDNLFTPDVLSFDKSAVDKSYKEYFKSIEKNEADFTEQQLEMIKRREELYDAYIKARDKFSSKKTELNGDYSNLDKNRELLQAGSDMVNIAKQISEYTKEIGQTEYKDVDFSKVFKSMGNFATELKKGGVLGAFEEEAENLSKAIDKFIDIGKRISEGSTGFGEMTDFIKPFLEQAKNDAKQAQDAVKQAQAINEELKKAETYVDENKKILSSLTGSKSNPKKEGQSSVYSKFNELTKSKNDALRNKIGWSPTISSGAATALEYQYVGEITNLLKNAGDTIRYNKSSKDKDIDGALKGGFEYYDKLIAEKPELESLKNAILGLNTAIEENQKVTQNATQGSSSTGDMAGVSNVDVEDINKVTEARRKLNDELERAEKIGTDVSNFTASYDDDAQSMLASAEALEKLNDEKERSAKLGVGGTVSGQSVTQPVQEESEPKEQVRTLEQVNEELEKEKANYQNISQAMDDWNDKMSAYMEKRKKYEDDLQKDYAIYDKDKILTTQSIGQSIKGSEAYQQDSIKKTDMKVIYNQVLEMLNSFFAKYGAAEYLSNYKDTDDFINNFNSMRWLTEMVNGKDANGNKVKYSGKEAKKNLTEVMSYVNGIMQSISKEKVMEQNYVSLENDEEYKALQKEREENDKSYQESMAHKEALYAEQSKLNQARQEELDLARKVNEEDKKSSSATLPLGEGSSNNSDLEERLELLYEIQRETEEFALSTRQLNLYNNKELGDQDYNDLTESQQNIVDKYEESEQYFEEFREKYKSFIVTLKDGKQIIIDSMEGLAYLKNDNFKNIESISYSFTDAHLAAMKLEEDLDTLEMKSETVGMFKTSISNLLSGEDLEITGDKNDYLDELINNYGIAEDKAQLLADAMFKIQDLFNEYGDDAFQNSEFLKKFDEIREYALSTFKDIGQDIAKELESSMNELLSSGNLDSDYEKEAKQVLSEFNSTLGKDFKKLSKTATYTLPLNKESSGQLAFQIDGVKEASNAVENAQNSIQQEVTETNQAIEGQIDLFEYMRQKINEILTSFENLDYKVRNLNKTPYDGNRIYDKHGYLFSDEEWEKAKQDSLVSNKTELNSSIADILKNDGNALEILENRATSLKKNLEPVQEMINRISKNSSIKDIHYDDIANEAAKINKELSTMYDQGIVDAEKFVMLQEKLWKLIQKQSDVYGGVQGSGAKNASELRSWIFNSWEQDTGSDFTHSIDAIFGGGNFSIIDNATGKLRTLRDLVGDIIDYNGFTFSGGFGASEDFRELERINRLLSYIKENKADILNIKNKSTISTLPLNEETSGQLALQTDGVKEASFAVENSQESIREEIAETNQAIEGQINLFDYLKNVENQKSTISNDQTTKKYTSQKKGMKLKYFDGLDAYDNYISDSTGGFNSEKIGTNYVHFINETEKVAIDGEVQCKNASTAINRFFDTLGNQFDNLGIDELNGWKESILESIKNGVYSQTNAEGSAPGTYSYGVEQLDNGRWYVYLNQVKDEYIGLASVQQEVIENQEKINNTSDTFDGQETNRKYKASSPKIKSAKFSNQDTNQDIISDLKQEEQVSTESTGVVVTNEEKKQQAYKETVEAIHEVKNAEAKKSVDTNDTQKKINEQNELQQEYRETAESIQEVQSAQEKYKQYKNTNNKYGDSDNSEFSDFANFKVLKQVGTLDTGAIVTYKTAEGQIGSALQRLDENGNIITEKITPLITNFETLKKEFKSTFSEIVKLQSELKANQSKYGDNYDSKAIEKVIADKQKDLELLSAQVDLFASDKRYASEYSQFLDDYSKIKNEILDKQSIKNAVIDAKTLDEQDKQLNKLEEVKSRYNKKLSSINSAFKDLSEYKNAKSAIDDLVDINDVNEVETAFNKLDKIINDFKQNVKSSASLDPVFSAMKKKDNLGNIVEEYQLSFEKLGFSTEDAKKKVENLLSISNKIKEIDLKSGTGMVEFGKEMQNFNAEEERLKNILNITKQRNDIQKKANQEESKQSEYVSQAYKDLESSLAAVIEKENQLNQLRKDGGTSKQIDKAQQNLQSTLDQLESNKALVDDLALLGEIDTKSPDYINYSSQYGAAVDSAKQSMYNAEVYKEDLARLKQIEKEKAEAEKASGKGTSSTKGVVTLESAYKNLTKTYKEYLSLEEKKKAGTATDEQSTRLRELIAERERYNKIIGQEATTDKEKFAKQDYETLLNKETELRTKYASLESSIKNALNNTSSIMSKFSTSNMEGFDRVFANAEQKVDALNESLQTGKISLETYSKRIKDIASDLSNVLKVTDTGLNTEQAEAALKKYANTLKNVEIGKFNADNNTLKIKFEEQAGVIKEVTLKYDELTGAIKRAKEASGQSESGIQSFISGLKKRFESLSQYLLTFVSFYEVVNVVKQGITVVRDLDTAFTEMRKVSDESTESLKNFQSASFDVASSVGTTAKQIQNSTADWMRLGESLDEASESAEVANVLLNVSEFESIDEATESLVAMSAAYDELDKMEIVDKMNLIGNNFAISTDGLATALQKSASALKTAGKYYCLKYMETYVYRTHLIARIA